MLVLPIKKKWFDMILLGEKKEEYREIKPYYVSRFSKLFCSYGWDKQKIMFRNGYGKDSPSFIAKCTLSVGIGKREWGAELGKKYYILKILEIQDKFKC